jgi:hypothetical protein
MLSPLPPLLLPPPTPKDGCLQHAESGLFVHPLKGSAYTGCPLILHPDGPEHRLAFNTMAASDLGISAFLTHAATGLCVAPRDGKGSSGCNLLFIDDLADADADFRFVSDDETRAKARFAQDIDEAGELAAEAAKLALQRRGDQLQVVADKSQNLQV